LGGGVFHIPTPSVIGPRCSLGGSTFILPSR
jgi:hypothetical protein